MNNMVHSRSQMVNVIMSQDANENRQSSLSVGQQAMNHSLSSALVNEGQLLVNNVLSSTGAIATPNQQQPVTFKREIMDTDVNPF